MPRYHARATRGFPLGFILLIILLLVFGLLAVRFYPLVTASRFGRPGRFNVVFTGRPVTVISLDPRAGLGAVIVFPDDLYMTSVIHGYGQYPISNVFRVGELDKRGGETLAGTLREYLGVPVSGYWVTSGSFLNPRSYFLNPAVILHDRSDLNPLDRLRFILDLERIRQDKLKIIDLRTIASPLVLADGSKAQLIEQDSLDNFLQGLFDETSLRTESLRLAVINSTGYPGLGNRVARILTNAGASVVNVSSVDSVFPQCQISASPKAFKSVTVSLAAAVFSCQVGKAYNSDSADAKIIVGDDYVRWLTK